MKTCTSFSSLFLCMLIGAVQLMAVGPTITWQNRPVVGVTTKMQPVKTAGLNPGASGANVTWDFSGVTANGSETSSTFITASTTPGFSLFPSATIANYSASNPNDYSFFEISESRMRILGNVSPTDTMVYNGFDFFRFPISFGTNYTTEYGGSEHDGATVNEISTIDTTDADAYGTIKLPNGTFNNVLRIRRHGLFTETSTNVDNNFSAYMQQYYYVDPTTPGGSLFQIVGFQMPLVGYQIVSAEYYVGSTGGSDVGDEATSPSDFRIAPQPANNCLWINSSFIRESQTRFVITDIVGRVVASGSIDPGAPYRVDISTLPQGLYSLTIQYNGRDQHMSITVVH